ncbi:MAG: hypothetical protein ACI9MC_000036 [Kiritimatiellia bacterium]|jgi:hypothetical protein
MTGRSIVLGIVSVLALGACNDTGFTGITIVDYFQQSRRNELDLLVVIDNSCSMVEEQNNLANNFDALISAFTTAEVDWQIAVTTTDVEAERFRGLLVSGDDEIIVRSATGGEIDRVEYDRAWLFEEGVALQLNREWYRGTSNLNPANWCAAPTDYVEGHKGSPGEWNPSCDGDVIAPPENEEDAGPRGPKAGRLIVTEIMANASGVDSLCEWFELTNLDSDTVDLTDVTISDRGNNAVRIPGGVTVGPHDVIVMGRSLDGEVNCGVPVDVAMGDGFTLMNHQMVLTAETEDGNELFQEMIAQGTSGSGIEHGLEGAALVFQEPYYTEQNNSWLRDEASLAVLIVSDEDDVSPYSVTHYERFFKQLKGDQAFRQDGWFTLNAVVGKEPTDNFLDPSCISDNGDAFYAKRYIDFASRTGGIVESICEEDFTPIITNLGLSISGLNLEFKLRVLPRLDTLRVRLYEDSDEASFVRDLNIGTDFEYVPDGNLLKFNEQQIPPPEYYVTASYTPKATGADADQPEETE